MAEIFQRFAGGTRECSLFDGISSAKVDAMAICHEVRCIKLVPGEKTCISFRIIGRREDEAFSTVGEMRELRSLEPNDVVLLRVWAALEEPPTAAHAERRACGEAHIPLQHLISHCDGMLYRTWIALDSPGLNESMACVGHIPTPASDGEAFTKALDAAPRQLFQPKACITVCRGDDLGPSRQPLWTVEASAKERSARWRALLRSQRQHVLLATTQHLHGAQAQKEQHAQAEQQTKELESQALRHAQEQDALRERLRGCQEQLWAGEGTGPKSPQRRASFRELEETAARQLEESLDLAESSAERASRRSREAEATAEAEQQRNMALKLEGEVQSLEEELASIRQEAKDKMEAADANIAALHRRCDDAAKLAKQKKAEGEQLQQEVNQISQEAVVLAEQKEALMKIVEDLHQICNSHGLTAGTEAINGITRYRFP